MKGLVFTEFMEMVEAKYGIDMVDELIDESDPPSGGSYTAIDTYDHEELVNMVLVLSQRVGVDFPSLVKTFGHHLAQVFFTKFPGFFNDASNTIEFLKKIDDHIHVEVAKLYPDAELPVFSYDDSNPDEFKLRYESNRPFADLAHGLIEETAKIYQENFTISRLDERQGQSNICHFCLVRVKR